MLPNYTAVLPVTNIQIPFAYFELIPVVYLLLISGLDVGYGLVSVKHIKPIIEEIKISIIKHRKSYCPIILKPRKGQDQSCPIVESLETYIGNIEEDTNLWSTVGKGIRLQNQATFFEIISIQMFILFLASSNWFVLLLTMVFFGGPYLGSTFIKQNLVTLFQPGGPKVQIRYIMPVERTIPNGIFRIPLVIGVLIFGFYML